MNRTRTVGRDLVDWRERASSGQVRLWPLAALALLVTASAAAGLIPRWPGVVHLVGLPPLDLYGDLRLLLTWAPSWPLFLLGLGAALTLRVSVLVLMLGGFTRARVRFAVTFYLVSLPVLLLAAEAAYAAAALLYSRLFWPALTVVAVVTMLVGPVPWQGSTRLRSAVAGLVRAGLRAPVMLTYAVVVAGLGALADTGSAVAVWLVPVSALATALTIRTLSRPAPRWALWRLAGVVVAILFASVVFVSTRGVEPGPAASPRPGSVLLMSGINSGSGRGTMFSSRSDELGYDCDQTYYFSYARTSPPGTRPGTSPGCCAPTPTTSVTWRPGGWALRSAGSPDNRRYPASAPAPSWPLCCTVRRRPPVRAHLCSRLTRCRWSSRYSPGSPSRTRCWSLGSAAGRGGGRPSRRPAGELRLTALIALVSPCGRTPTAASDRVDA
ncbi:hypothetical protein O7634_30245 [Micromonospora sp. WMMD1120]|uniref:hypothetical protein n=1 Tax=Micromonospora sp. WMMD1120 TaxID=3016106 RepID=UPI002416B084|nr:hypothetical protein [Micromonospora sp. WMMD1120]MDG4811062.1 hypothetical protein [Micromonospora sp. WMMD1120]